MNSEHQHNNYEDKSGREMLSDIGRLLWKLILKCIARLLRLILKGVLLCFTLIKMLLQACIDFWYDNSTQEKLHIAKNWFFKTMKLIGSYCLAACVALKKGIVWTVKAFIIGITHLKPTITYVGRLCAKTGKAIWKSIVNGMKYIRLYILKKQHAFRRFRRNKGFKGLLIDTKNYLQMQLNNYMEEDNETTSNDVISYEEYVNEDKGNGKESFGRKLYNEMDKLFDN